MSQHDMNIANQGFPAFRSDLNNALAALVSNSSGATAPTTTFAHQFWLDTSTTPNRLRQRNADNDAWIEVGRLDQVADTYQAAAVVDGVYTTGNQTIAGTKTFSTAPVVPGLNGGQLAGMRNKIINGKMEIAQRGTSFAAAADGAYTLDRWFNSITGGGVVTVSQQSDVPSSNEFQNSLRSAVTTADTSIAAGDYAGLVQHIEGFIIRDLIGRSFTLSFWVRSSKTGTHCISIRNAGPSAADRSYVVEYTVSAANTWEFKSVTVSGGLITAGTWNWTNGIGLRLFFAMAAGTTFQTTAGAWQTGNFLATSNQVNCLDSNTNIFALTGVQLEVGGVATPFEHRSFGAELALCQRYYYRVGGQLLNDFGSGYINSTSQAQIVTPFPVSMRAAPSALEQSGTASHYGVLNLNTSTTCTSVPAFVTGATNMARTAFNTGATLTAGQGCAGRAENTTSAYLAWSAEL